MGTIKNTMETKYKKYIFYIKKIHKISNFIFALSLNLFILTSCLSNKENNHNVKNSKLTIDSNSNSNSKLNLFYKIFCCCFISNSDSNYDFDSDSYSEDIIVNLKTNIYGIRKLKKKYIKETNKEKAAIIYKNANLLADEMLDFVSKLENSSSEIISILDESAKEMNNFRGPVLQ